MKTWTLKKADTEFSLFIRKRDPACKRCRWRKSTEASHYWERSVGSARVRYDPRNADGLCFFCHPLWEGRKGGYKEYKLKQLGKKEYMDLEQQARNADGAFKREDAIINLMEMIKGGSEEYQIPDNCCPDCGNKSCLCIQ